ncbi:MAG: hypothetical protein QXS02_05625 [Candidatus Thermoplasmatota archaeon]
MRNLKLCRIFLIGGMLLVAILFVSVISDAVGIDDEQNDVYHWRQTGTAWSWQVSVVSKPNIDIIKLSYSYVGSTLTLSMQVAGEIENSSNIVYWMYVNTTDMSYFFWYNNGEGYALGVSNGSSIPVAYTGAISPGGDTLNAVFNGVGSEPVNAIIWGWTGEYTNKNDPSSSDWWSDWAPNVEAPWYTGGNGGEEPGEGEEGETPGEGEAGNEGGEPGAGEEGEPPEGEAGNGGEEPREGGNETNGVTTKKKGTPGFELLLILAGVIISLILIQRRKKID